MAISASRTLLVVSLALNVFLGGVVVARWVVPHGHPPDFRAPPPGGMQRPGPPGQESEKEAQLLRSVVHALGGPKDPRVKGLLGKKRALMHAERNGLEEARRAVFEALTAEAFDPERLRSALVTLRTRTSQAQLNLHEAVSLLALELSPEERARLKRK